MYFTNDLSHGILISEKEKVRVPVETGYGKG